ncbi:hypothetical protein [Roseateles sp. P5_E11]
MSDPIDPIDSINGRLEGIENRVSTIEKAVSENTRATLEGNRDAREILELFQAVRGGFKVLGWLGTAAKWVAGVAAAVSALWVLFHQVNGPKP